MQQLPPSDEELGLFADQHDPDFYLDGVKLPQSSDNVLKALGPEVVVPVTHFHPADQVHSVAASNLRSPTMAIARGVPPARQAPLHLRPGQLQVHEVPYFRGVVASNLRSPTMAIPRGVPPAHQVALRPGQLQVHEVLPYFRGVAASMLRSPAMATAPGVRPRPRPPIHQSEKMLRTVHVSPIPLSFHDTIQFKLQMEQIFGVNTIEECKLPIRHQGYGFVTFYLKETFDAAISRRVIELHMGQGPEVDTLSLRPACRR